MTDPARHNAHLRSTDLEVLLRGGPWECLPVLSTNRQDQLRSNQQPHLTDLEYMTALAREAVTNFQLSEDDRRRIGRVWLGEGADGN